MNTTQRLDSSQINLLTSQLFLAQPTRTRHGTVYDGRFLSKHVDTTTAVKRDRSEPLLRGYFKSIGEWKNLGWLPMVEVRPAVMEVHCPFCDLPHRFGWPETFLSGRYISHRGSHCGAYKGKRVRSVGYWIAPLRKSDVGFNRHVINPGLVIARRAFG